MGAGAVVGAERPDDAQAGCEVAPDGLGHSDVNPRRTISCRARSSSRT